jgi:hypothetical protein
MECSIPFVLWHQTGFSISLTEHIERFIASGMSLHECESMLIHNRLQRLYFQTRKLTGIASYQGELLSTLHSIREVLGFSLLRQSPSRNAIKGCFLFRYGKWKEVYDSRMKN